GDWANSLSRLGIVAKLNGKLAFPLPLRERVARCERERATSRVRGNLQTHESETPHPVLAFGSDHPLPQGESEARPLVCFRNDPRWREGVATQREGETPHPTPLPTAVGAGRARLASLAQLAHRQHQTKRLPRTRRTPSPRRGEGWGEGVATQREGETPHPTPLPTA